MTLPHTDKPRLIKDPRDPILVIGRAGSGKSTLIADFVGANRHDTIVVSPTGIAALNLEDQVQDKLPGYRFRVPTIHGAFSFRPGMSDIVKPITMGPRQQEAFRAARYLVIDEISMVRADILDRVNLTLMILRNCPMPFGGLVTIMVGDPFQLPPVVPRDDIPFLQKIYGPECVYAYFFESWIVRWCLNKGRLRVFDKMTSWRQSDKGFVAALDAMRYGTPQPDALRVLAPRVGLVPSDPGAILHLTVDLASAKQINDFYLARLESKPFTSLPGRYLYDERFEENLRDHPMNNPVTLKEGLRVIFTQNDLAGRWRNGSRGWITRIEGTTVYASVRGVEVLVEPVTFEVSIPQARKGGVGVEPYVVAAVIQLPLLGGHAITIHRSQSLTLDEAIIGFGRGVSTPGQAYTAVSRVRSKDGLFFSGPVHPHYFQVSPTLVKFVERIQPLICKLT